MLTIPHDEYVIVHRLRSMYHALETSAIQPVLVPDVNSDILLLVEAVLPIGSFSHVLIDAYAEEDTKSSQTVYQLMNLRTTRCAIPIQEHSQFHKDAATYFRHINVQFKQFNYADLQHHTNAMVSSAMSYAKTLEAHAKVKRMPQFLFPPKAILGEHIMCFDADRPYVLNPLRFNDEATVGGFVDEYEQLSEDVANFFTGFSKGHELFAIRNEYFGLNDRSLEGMLAVNAELLTRASTHTL